MGGASGVGTGSARPPPSSCCYAISIAAETPPISRSACRKPARAIGPRGPVFAVGGHDVHHAERRTHRLRLVAMLLVPIRLTISSIASAASTCESDAEIRPRPRPRLRPARCHPVRGESDSVRESGRAVATVSAPPSSLPDRCRSQAVSSPMTVWASHRQVPRRRLGEMHRPSAPVGGRMRAGNSVRILYCGPARVERRRDFASPTRRALGRGPASRQPTSCRSSRPATTACHGDDPRPPVAIARQLVSGKPHPELPLPSSSRRWSPPRLVR